MKTASELLRELERELAMPPTDDMEMIRRHETRETVVHALPELRALVEYYEILLDAHPHQGQSKIEGAKRLVALREKLNNATI